MTEKEPGPESVAALRFGRYSGWIILTGIVLFGILLILPPPATMPLTAWRVVAVGSLMAFWWVTEVLPVAATALLPIILFPLLGVASLDAAAAPYADPIIFLFFGGLMLGLAVQKWGLHRRVALAIVFRVGLRPGNLVLGFMAATAFLSMWISNTATAAMMLPVSVSLVALLVGSPRRQKVGGGRDSGFALALLLGVAFAASIGGMATIIGTPPNALFAGFMARTYGIEIGFARWMMLGLPVSLFFLFGTWLVLTRVVFRIPNVEQPGVRQRLAAERQALPPISTPEKRVALIFAAAAAAWMFRPLVDSAVPGLSDTGIALAAGFMLFVIPSGRGGFLVDWPAALRLPWGVLLLFGGGLSLAAAISGSGLSGWIGEALLQFGRMPFVVLLAALIIVTILLSELASNTATAAALLPVVGAIALALGLDAFALSVPVVLAASCGFMLPVATPPNALFYGSGYITVAQMARAGLLVDLLGAALVLGASVSLARMVF